MIVTEEFNSAVKIFIVEGWFSFFAIIDCDLYFLFLILPSPAFKMIFRNKQRWFEYGNEQC